MKHPILKAAPAVFAVGKSYQIMVPVKGETLMWVQVGEQRFCDHVNGTLRSATDIHRMTVPQALLDAEKAYTLCYRVVKERKPYFTETEEEQRITFPFAPVVGASAKAFLIADAHNEVEATTQAVKQFERKYGSIDFLILAGDIPVDSGKVENFDTIYEIIEKGTQGGKPVVYAKGNHDLRGVCAEKMEEYAPNLNGKSYFTFRIGDIWGISLDCGEDKEDGHAEYGHTVCCHQFRLEETAYIEEVIANAGKEYAEDGVKHKIVVVHNPFTEQLQPPFDIEKEIFSRWSRLLKDYVQPDIMISGHFHRLAVNEAGGENDHLGQPCRVVVGTKPFQEKGVKHYIGTGFLFGEEGISFVFIDDSGKEYA